MAGAIPHIHLQVRNVEGIKKYKIIQECLHRLVEEKEYLASGPENEPEFSGACQFGHEVPYK